MDVSGVPPVRLLELLDAVGPPADDRECLGAVAACEQLLRLVSALQVRFLAGAVQACEAPADGSAVEVFSGVELVAAEVGVLFGLSRRSAQNKVARACALVTDLPGLVDLVETGALDLARAVAVDDVMREVLHPDEEAWATVAEAITARAPGCSNRWLRELTRRAVTNADPAAAARRHEQAVATRQVVLDPLPDAMATVTATLPADQAQLVDSVLDALADHHRDHSTRLAARTHDQRRADAFVAVFRSIATATPIPLLPATATQVGDALPGGHLRPAAADGQATVGGVPGVPEASKKLGVLGWWVPPVLPRQQGRRPNITVTMPLSTLIGAGENAGDLAGYGPIPAPLARAIAAEAARYQVAVLPDTPSRGSAGWHGPGDERRCTDQDRAYRPPRSLADQVIASHQVCRHPHCARRAERCDLDHVTPHPDGPTCACNLMPLCRFHHRLKTHGGWNARFTTADELYPAGTVEWTTPHGRRYYDMPRIHDLDFGSSGQQRDEP